MANMHPKTIISDIPSEVKFFNACRDQLSSKFHVFYSVRWYETRDGLREDSECDFLVYNPDYGFLTIEVKGGYSIEVEDGKWFLNDCTGGRILKESPYKQSEKSMRFFKKYYEDELETVFPGIYGSAVAFPMFSVNSPITVDSPLEITIDSSQMTNLQQRIIEIFRYFRAQHTGYTSFFAPDSQKKFINLINKRVALSIAAGALIEDKERELQEINKIQDTVIDLLSHYSKAFVVGGAGTGKTWIAIKKIKRAVAQGKKSLYLCSSPELSKTVSSIVNDKNADCYTMDELMSVVLEGNTENIVEMNGCKEYSSVLSSTDISNFQYDIIVVDEGQDFNEDWAFCANLLIRNNGSLYVFYDENQNIFNRSFGEKFYIDYPPFVLRYNVRNTANIYRFTQNQTYLGMDTIANQIEGVEPEQKSFSRESQVISYIDSIVNKLVNREGVSPSKITIVSNKCKQNSILKDVNYVGGCRISENWLNDSILYKMVKDFKGLESDIIIYLNHSFINEPLTDERKALNYTAMTRARFYLYIIDFIEKID